MMGGSGTRMGGEIPKQLLEVNNTSVYQFILNLYNMQNIIDEVVLISNSDWTEHVKKQLNKKEYKFPINIIDGGRTRAESIKNGVLFLDERKNGWNGIVLIHDVTHPYLDVSAVSQLLSILDKSSSATIVTHIWDTVYDCDNEFVNNTLKRERIGVGASPEGFRFDFLRKIFTDKNMDINKFTCVGNHVQSIGEKLAIVWSPVINLKITYPDDFEIFKESQQYFKK